MKTIIEFKEVTKAYGTGENRLLAADRISFSVGEGEFVVILGPSGAGKSTLLNLLGGMEHATSGEILVNGQNIVGLRDRALTDYRARHVGFVFQFYNLIPTLTALENVALTKDVVKNALEPEEVLRSVGLSDHLSQFPSQLSGGEQQRVSIARALSKDPTMLLCDEPTGALDSETGVMILTLLQKMSRERKKTVLIVTHNAAFAQCADKVIRIKNGRVCEVAVNDSPLAVDEVIL